MYKKLLSIILALCAVFGCMICGYAAEENDYDFVKDARLTVVSDDANGDIQWGQAGKFMFQITKKKIYYRNEVAKSESELTPDDEEVPEGTLRKTVVLADQITNNSMDVEAVSIEFKYATRCPACNKAVFAPTIFSIYSQNNGRCPHCEYKFPNPDNMKIYRFLVVCPDSAHFEKFSEFNFEPYEDRAIKETEKLYGDGRDLAYGNYVFEETEDEELILTDFTTNKVKNGKSVKQYINIVKISDFVVNASQWYSQTKFVEILFKVRLFFAQLIEKVVTAILS